VHSGSHCAKPMGNVHTIRGVTQLVIFLWDEVTGVGYIAGLVQEKDGNLSHIYMNDQPHAQSLSGLAMNHDLPETTTCNISTALKIE